MVSFLYNLYIFGYIFELCSIQNRVITNHVIINRVIKRLMCTCTQLSLSKLIVYNCFIQYFIAVTRVTATHDNKVLYRTIVFFLFHTTDA